VAAGHYQAEQEGSQVRERAAREWGQVSAHWYVWFSFFLS
jgi:hypothetical protein